jgi:hypothetical protein
MPLIPLLATLFACGGGYIDDSPAMASGSPALVKALSASSAAPAASANSPSWRIPKTSDLTVLPAGSATPADSGSTAPSASSGTQSNSGTVGVSRALGVSSSLAVLGVADAPQAAPLAVAAASRTFYVDSRDGDDLNDGLSLTQQGTG